MFTGNSIEQVQDHELLSGRDGKDEPGIRIRCGKGGEEFLNQTEAVLTHLKANRGITSYEAFSLYGATRLADIIYRLRQKGYNITTSDRSQKDRYGNRVDFVEYRLEES